MKTKQEKTTKKKLPKGFEIDTSLTNKYNNEPLFKKKIDKANHILKTVGLPKNLTF